MEALYMKQTFIIVFRLILFILVVNPNVYCQNIGLVNVRYEEQFITVGGPDADVSGFTSGAIQIALDAIKTRGMNLRIPKVKPWARANCPPRLAIKTLCIKV